MAINDAGTEHAVEVTAESLYEAVAQALGVLRGDIWVEEIGEGLTELKVRVRQPAVEHWVRMKDFRRWLESQGKTPAECTRKRWLMGLARGRTGAMIRTGDCPPAFQEGDFGRQTVPLTRTPTPGSFRPGGFCTGRRQTRQADW